MEAMIKYFFICICLSIVVGCNSDVDTKQMFVTKYQDEDFTFFSNSQVYLRGKDRNGDFIIFVGGNLKGECESPFIIIIDKNTKKIKLTSNHLNLLEGNCTVNEEKMKKIALKYMEYKIDYINVDQNDNVFFKINGAERPNLVRFSDIRYKTASFKDWKQIKGNWYGKEE